MPSGSRGTLWSVSPTPFTSAQYGPVCSASASTWSLKENQLVSYETVLAEAIRFYCSRIAGRWDSFYAICYLRLAGAGLCALTSDPHLHASFHGQGSLNRSCGTGCGFRPVVRV